MRHADSALVFGTIPLGRSRVLFRSLVLGPSFLSPPKSESDRRSDVLRTPLTFLPVDVLRQPLPAG